jgi:hypothetical protein
MKVWAGCHVIFCDMKVDFSCFLIGFHEKNIKTKVNIGPKNAEYSVDERFGWVSCEICDMKVGIKQFFINCHKKYKGQK